MSKNITNDLCSEFYEFYNNKSSETIIHRKIKPLIALHYDVIEALVNDGNSLKSIYNFLVVEKQIKCSYGYFIRMYKELKSAKSI